MSMFGFNQGQVQSSTPLALVGIGENDILTPGTSNGGSSGFEIATVIFAVGGAANVSLKVFDGTTSSFLLNAHAVAATDGGYPWPVPYVLPFGWTLRAVCSVGGVCTVTVTYVSVKK